MHCNKNSGQIKYLFAGKSYQIENWSKILRICQSLVEKGEISFSAKYFSIGQLSLCGGSGGKYPWKQVPRCPYNNS